MKQLTDKEKKVITFIKTYGHYDHKEKRYYMCTYANNHVEIKWTFWDDNIVERTDDNGEVKTVTGLYYTPERGVVVELNNASFDNSNSFSSYDFDDEGWNFAEHILDRLEEELGYPFDYQEENSQEDFSVFTINRQDLKDSGIKSWKSVSDETMQSIASKMGDYIQEYGDWRDDLRCACEKFGVK